MSFDGPDYLLRWPPDLLVNELTAVETSSESYPDEDMRHVLVEAFVGTAAADHWTGLGRSTMKDARRTPRRDVFVTQLKEAALEGLLRTEDERSPRYSARRNGSPRPRVILDSKVTRLQFARIVTDFENAGYFAARAPISCPDSNDDGPSLSELVEAELGKPMWPLAERLVEADDDTFFDLVEILHDLVARPRRYSSHDGWCPGHYRNHAIGPGQRLYRYRVNELLGRGDSHLRLVDEGENAGLLVDVVDDERRVLVAPGRWASDPDEGTIEHAIALFQRRDADVPTKRSAIVALAGVLEGHRKLLRAELLRKDESALFEIANSFDLRHRDASQQKDYDAAFLDWLFWWYLATIELARRLVSRPK